MNETHHQSADPGKPLAGMRVLVMFGASELFGAERSNLEVFRTLRELGLEVHFLTHKRHGPAQIEPELKRLGFEWTPTWFGYQWGRYLFGREFYYWFINLWCILATNWRVWRMARQFRATHLYAMSTLNYSYANVAAKWLPIPLVYRVGELFPKHNIIYRTVLRSVVARADVVVAISEFIKRNCVADGFTAGRIKVIYNYPPARPSLPARLPPVPPGAQVVCYVGQLSESKGVLVLLAAAAQLLKSGKNVVFWLVGAPCWDEGQFDQIRAQAAGTGFGDRIHFTGYQQDVLPYLAGADIHVCPSLVEEALSNVVGEAKLNGKPSVVFPSGGLPETVQHGEDGFICRDKSVTALVEGLEYFLDDPVRRQAAGQAARKNLEERFSRAKYIQAWTEVFLAARRGKMPEFH